MEEYYFNEITSTQDYAKKISLDDKQDFVVFSNIQTNGRGRFSRTWEAPSGGLWFSFDCDGYNKDGLFTIIIGVATREVLAKVYGCNVKLKWPNDLILDNKKVGGIICEKINDRIIVGIGINTNVKNIQEKNAVTFLEKTGISISNYEIMNEIIKCCKKYLSNPLDDIIKKFRENMAYVGEEHFVSALNEKVKILNISDEGKLIVESNGGIKEIFTGEIECI